MLTGACHCRRVRYETDGSPFNATICHCTDCRRVSGAASVAWFSVPRASLRWTGAMPAAYASSPGVTRRFCGTCGTSLTFEDEQRHPDELDIATATLDDPDRAPPKDHVFASQRPVWDVIGDGLPVHARSRRG